MTNNETFPYPELKQDDYDAIGEYARKLIDSGVDEETAELEAMAEVLNKKKTTEKNGPQFIKIGGAEIKPTHWIIKNFLEAGALGMVFGDSGTYKSFTGIALAGCIATGKDFYGLPVRRKGAVYYVAAEGRNGIVRRFRAWSQENSLPINDAPIYLYNGIVNLLEAADILIKALEEAIKTETEPPALVIIDTWARSLGDDDSDTSSAAEGLFKIDSIRIKFQEMAVLIIHHTGHTNKDRARGASLLHAAVDSEYRLELDRDKNIVMSNIKSKESELLPPMAFKARTVKLLGDDGAYILNEDGEIETSAVLDSIDYEPPVDGLGVNQEKILQILRKQEDKNLIYDDLLEAFKQETHKSKGQFDRALTPLEDKGIIYHESGFVCLA